jgi:phosphoglycolate phosphatase
MAGLELSPTMKNWIVLFDLDGTLIDSVPDICGSLNRTLAKINRRALSTEEVSSYLGQGSHLFMTSALRATGVIENERVITKLVNEFLTDYARNPVVDTVAFPGVFAALDELENNGARLAVCTNKPSHLVESVLNQLGLTRYFGTILCGDEVKNRKPHADHILETIRLAGGNASSSAVMVGDNVNDFVSAKSAGIPSVAVSFGYAVCAAEDLGASVLIDHFGDLVSAVSQIVTSSIQHSHMSQQD